MKSTDRFECVVEELISGAALVAWSGGRSWQTDDGIIAQGRDGFQPYVAGALNDPFVVLIQQRCADKSDEGNFIGEADDDFAAPLGLAVDAFEQVCAVDLGGMGAGKPM
jgi:hypothetical protein